MATVTTPHRRTAATPQRNTTEFRRAWTLAVRRVARRDRAILAGLAAHDRGEGDARHRT